MSEIICPHCGSSNPIEADNCSICHKSLYEEPSQPYNPPAGHDMDWLKDYRGFGSEGTFISDEESLSDAGTEQGTPAGTGFEPEFETDASSKPANKPDAAPESGEGSDIPEWLARVRERTREDAKAAGQEFPTPADEPKFKVGEPIKTDWLRDLTGDEEKPAADESTNYPDWLKRISARAQEAKKAKEAEEVRPPSPFDLTGEIGELHTPSLPDEARTSSPFIQPEEETMPAIGAETTPENEAELFDLYSQELESLAVQPPETHETSEIRDAEPPPDLMPPEPEPTTAVEGLPAFITEGLPEEPVSEALEPLEEIEPIPDIDWLDQNYIKKSEPETSAADEVSGIDWAGEEAGETVLQPWDALANLERLQAESEEPAGPFADEKENLGSLTGEGHGPVEDNDDALADLDWLKAQSEETSQPFGEVQAAQDWLSSSKDESAEDALANLERLMAEGHETVEEKEDMLADQDWLKAQTSEPLQPFEETQATPDWLSALKEESEEPSPAAEPEQPVQPGEIPEWLFGQEEAEPSAEPPVRSGESTTAAAFEPGEEFSIYDEEVLPDWLKEETSAAPAEISAATAPAKEKPGIPDWLKDLPSAEPGGPTKISYLPEEHIEESGPLAGFQGLLPGEDTVTHYAKPPTYTGTLQVTEKQRIYATMFDTIISSEKKVEAAAAKKVTASSQVLRLFAGILMVGVVTIALFFDARIAAPPTLYPSENAAFFDSIQTITNTTASSRILVGMDYEPALSGELGTISTSVLQDLMAGNSSLAFVSLSPTGPALAEDLVRRANQAVPDYLPAEKVVNLGYLPGGASALAGLAASPVDAAPYTTNGAAAWDSGPLLGVTSIRDFDAVLLLTDNSESARNWIEQIQTTAKDTPFLVVSSAQAVPALQPYVHSGQITGLLGGLSGAASYQQLTQDTSGSLSAYWDAYQVGMLLIAIFIILGAVVFGAMSLIAKFKKA